MNDREKLIELLMVWFLSCGDKSAHPKERIDTLAKYLIRSGVTIQKHGRWEEWWPGIHLIMTGEEMLYRCSVCDAKYVDVEGKKFCPNCGALLDEKET